MKQKKYSKQLALKTSSSSMLLRKQLPKSTGLVPLRLNPKLKFLNLSQQGITTLEGIEVYKQLQAIDISGNKFINFTDLEVLRNCQKLREICLYDTAVSEKINYPFAVASILPQIETIDGIFLGAEGYKGLENLQEDIGNRIRSFLLQKCKIGLEIGQIKKNCKLLFSLQEELIELKRILRQTQSQYSLLDLNWELKSHLPLSSIQTPDFSTQNAQEIQDYLLERIISQASANCPQFIEKRLNKIQVLDDEEQNMIVKQAVVAQQILKMEIVKDFEYSQVCHHFSQDQNSSKRHFVSAETALDSNDRYGYQSQKKPPIHFLLDREYVEVLRAVLANQCDFIISQISKTEETTKVMQVNSVVQDGKYISRQHNQSDEDSLELNFGQIRQKNQTQEDSLTIHQQLPFSSQPYNNPIILEKILNNFCRTIKKLTFNKIKSSKPTSLCQVVGDKVASALKRNVVQTYMFGLTKLYAESGHFQEVLDNLRACKVRRMFRGWKNIKKAKQAFLKKVMKRNRKAEEFTKAVYLTKWRMNIRSNTLRKMASQIILSRPKQETFACSRKGIDLVYKRVKEEYRSRAQLRLTKS